MSFAARITRAPRPFEADHGADGRALFPDQPPEVAEVIDGAAGCSPYLLDLMRKEADWLAPALADPEAALEAELAEKAALDLPKLGSGLRQAKRRVALLAGLADLAGVWALEDVTGALTRLADMVVDTALKRLVAAEIARGKLPGLGPEDAGTAGGMVALAMGKGGAHELNYSSDIDLICLFDETRFDPDAYHEARAGFIKVTRRMCALIGETTAEGYVFRTDLRLRPDASVTPVCLSMEAAERYYESVGRTWERAAYIKARAAAGDIAAGARFLDTLRPFVWRKHLDFAAIQDAHDMRLRIRAHKGLGGPITLPGHNMKLGRGGIREIEFFTQTRQLIAGGRDETLRLRGTGEGLAALARAGWVPEADAQTLTAHYRAHREIEHRVQMLRDAQTHDLPQTDDEFDRLAAFCGTDSDSLRATLTDRLEEVHEMTEGFFAPTEPTAAAPEFGEEITERWLTYPALRSDRAVEIFNRLKPMLLARLQEAAKPEEALLAFDGFLRGLPAGVQLFSLFEANPQLTRLIVDIAATAPALAQYLGRNSSVLDAVIGGTFFEAWPGCAALTEGLEKTLDRADDYEAQLDATRRWAKEWHFRIGVHHLRGLIDAGEAGRQYADLAEAVIAGLYPRVAAQFAEKHGPPPGRGAVVLGMGSLGAGRIHAQSDLDLIVIYDGAGQEASEGCKPLSVRAYYARLTQALVTALSAPMAEGKLYEVDMRLRPSGRQGPVATAFAAFERYQMDEAWTWEHLALTRARVVAGPPDLGADVEASRARVLAAKAGGDAVRGEVAHMRDRIAAAKPPEGPWDAKIGPGRLQDVELAGQALALLAGSTAHATTEQLDEAVSAGVIGADPAACLARAADLFWALQASGKLLGGGATDPDALGAGGRAMILRETGAESVAALARQIRAAAEAAAKTITETLGEGHETR
jgi:glutamate-ammonia-ligase adenylyltransferase